MPKYADWRLDLVSLTWSHPDSNVTIRYEDMPDELHP